MKKDKRGAYGKKMLRFIVKFWTNDIPKKYDDGKTAWVSGVITLPINEHKGIKKTQNVFFHNPEEILTKIKELMKKNDLRLVEQEKLKVLEL